MAILGNRIRRRLKNYAILQFRIKFVTQTLLGEMKKPRIYSKHEVLSQMVWYHVRDSNP